MSSNRPTMLFRCWGSFRSQWISFDLVDLPFFRSLWWDWI